MSHPGAAYGATSRGYSSREFWWSASTETPDVCRKVFAYVRQVESEQSSLFQRFLRYASLYDPHERMGLGGEVTSNEVDSFVADNVVQSAVDTAGSIIAKSRPRIAVNTDNGDWSTQRRAKWVERYLEQLFKATRFYQAAQQMFTDACVFGTGALKITPAVGEKKIRVERVLIDEIIVDERECRGRAPRHLHQRRIVDREELVDEYPDFEQQICESTGDGLGEMGFWADYRPLELDQVVVIESWRLPHRGRDGKLVPGRHTKCVANATLLDEEWTHDDFPFLFYRWAERRTGFYGRGIAEELAGRQRHINRMNWQFDRRLQQISVPRHFVHQADAAMAVKLVNTAGAVIPYRKEKPVTWTPQAVTGDEWVRLDKVIAGGLAQVGISPLSARSTKPAGVESAVAMRELTDTESERFARNVQNWEQIHIDAAEWFITWAKEMDDGAPEVAWKAQSITKLIKWKKVALGDEPYAISLDAAGAIARTPAGRMQRVIELAQSGLIGSDEARRLLEHPDLERAMSMANAAMEAAEHEIEMVLDGEDRVPEAYLNVAMTAGRFQMAYLMARNDGAPEEILEAMRDYIETCADILKKRSPANSNVPMGAAPPMGAPGPGPGGPPPMGAPMAPPTAALAPQAMQIQAA
jgi:hypothetical protein